MCKSNKLKKSNFYWITNHKTHVKAELEGFKCLSKKKLLCIHTLNNLLIDGFQKEKGKYVLAHPFFYQTKAVKESTDSWRRPSSTNEKTTDNQQIRASFLWEFIFFAAETTQSFKCIWVRCIWLQLKAEMECVRRGADIQQAIGESCEETRGRPARMCVPTTSTPTGSERLMISTCLGSPGCHHLDVVTLYVSDLFACYFFSARDRLTSEIKKKSLPLSGLLYLIIPEPRERFTSVMAHSGVSVFKMKAFALANKLNLMHFQWKTFKSSQWKSVCNQSLHANYCSTVSCNVCNPPA